MFSRTRFLQLLLLIPACIVARGGIVDNSGLEAPTSVDSLWSGVDAGGMLTGVNKIMRGYNGSSTVPLIGQDGKVGEWGGALPVSVSVADLNGDGLPDIMVADVSGYYRVFFNSGTKTEPKFTNCEMVPLYLSRQITEGWGGNAEFIRMVPRINLFDWAHRGVQDLMVGNYKGEVFFVPNAGTPSAPDFRQPPTVDAAIIRTAKAGMMWGNLFAPAAYDWNGDSKPDLLLGEGSYSANAIHLLINKGSPNAPKFGEDMRYFLAYGDGREQLVPTLADYSGDGKMDLLVGDSLGRVAVYLNSGEKWKPNIELKFSQFIKFGSSDSLNGPITVAAADMNGDGLFDLIIGDKDGHILMALNKGTKEQPKFDAPVPIKGVDPKLRMIYLPARGPETNHIGNEGHYATGWSLDWGYRKGNINGYYSVFSGKDDPTSGLPPGHHFLKAGYYPSLNKVFKPAAVLFPSEEKDHMPGEKAMGFFVNWQGGYGTPFAADVPGFLSPTNTYHARYIFKENDLKPDTSYTLTFKVKGAAYRDAKWTLAFYGRTKSETKVTSQGGRGAKQVTQAGLKVDTDIESAAITSASVSDWTTVSRSFRIHFKDHELNNADSIEAVTAVFEMRFTLEPYTGTFYLDDLQVTEGK